MEVDTTDHSRFLELPTDILHQILSLLHIETILNVRRVCKALDVVTFDRCADEHFVHIYCWIYTPNALERLRDILQNAPRLVARIQSVTLADDYLEDLTINDMYMVRNNREHISVIWYDTAITYYRWAKDLKEHNRSDATHPARLATAPAERSDSPRPFQSLYRLRTLRIFLSYNVLLACNIADKVQQPCS